MNKINIRLLLAAYCNGFFPMAKSCNSAEIEWFSPDLRAIFPLFDLKSPKSLNKFIKLHDIHFTVNADFDYVIRACASREETWISGEIIDIYNELHSVGFAHSVESRIGNEIIGGLYGVAIGGAFFGESMFNHISNGSKSAFYFLIEHLKKRNYVLLDSQFINDYTAQLGAIEIPREKYLQLLEPALKKSCDF